MRQITYIHERPDWPQFRWNQAMLGGLLAHVRHAQGRLVGRMEGLPWSQRVEAGVSTLTRDVVKSSAIEGETLDTGQVRSSIARQLRIRDSKPRKPDRHIDGIVQVMLDATHQAERPLTGERLFGWHAALFPTGRSGMNRITVGGWRRDEAGPMRVVSGPTGRRVHFQAPDAERVPEEMRRFIVWFETASGPDIVLRAGLAHLWFVTIHPFDDGNGRIARAIADMMLARADATRHRYYSVSEQIERDRKVYYRRLEAAQRGDLDITPWLEWLISCLGRAIETADAALNSILSQAKFLEKIDPTTINQRQRAIIDRLLGTFHGPLTTSKYAALSRCSTDTALRDISELVDRGILLKNPAGGRSTSYRLGTITTVRRP